MERSYATPWTGRWLVAGLTACMATACMAEMGHGDGVAFDREPLAGEPDYECTIDLHGETDCDDGEVAAVLARDTEAGDALLELDMHAFDELRTLVAYEGADGWVTQFGDLLARNGSEALDLDVKGEAGDGLLELVDRIRGDEEHRGGTKEDETGGSGKGKGGHKKQGDPRPIIEKDGITLVRYLIRNKLLRVDVAWLPEALAEPAAWERMEDEFRTVFELTDGEFFDLAGFKTPDGERVEHPAHRIRLGINRLIEGMEKGRGALWGRVELREEKDHRAAKDRAVKDEADDPGAKGEARDDHPVTPKEGSSDDEQGASGEGHPHVQDDARDRHGPPHGQDDLRDRQGPPHDPPGHDGRGHDWDAPEWLRDLIGHFLPSSR